MRAVCWLAAGLLFWLRTELGALATELLATKNVGDSFGLTLDPRVDGYVQPTLPLVVTDPSEAPDSVTSIEIIYPVDGAIEKNPITFKVQVNLHPKHSHLFAAQYENVRFCMEINGEIVHCVRLNEESQYHLVGDCTARVYLQRNNSSGDGRSFVRRSSTITFTSVNETEFSAHITRVIQRDSEKHRIGYQQSLVDWAQLQQRQQDKTLLQQLEQDNNITGNPSTSTGSMREEEIVLLVGVKTTVVSHFPFRQAIRETWASKSALPCGVKIFFLGCRPFAIESDEASYNPSESSNFRRIWEAIKLEKQVYGDLLTDELDCDDSYSRLADKVREFLHFAATRYPNTQCVMITDDDLYLRLDVVVSDLQRQGPRERFYAGYVRAIEKARKERPIRNPVNQNYVPKEQYPLNELPLFTLGASYILSMDCVRFVSKNRRWLSDLGGNDDLSVGLWMMIRQVYPKRYPGLRYLRAEPCVNNTIALSDLSVSAIRVIHSNIIARRPFCHGFEWYAWIRQDIGVSMEGRPHLLSFTPEPLHFAFTLPSSDETRGLQLTTMISTPSHAGIKIPFFSLNETVAAYSRRICALARLHFPGAAGTSSCVEIVNRVRSELRVLNN